MSTSVFPTTTSTSGDVSVPPATPTKVTRAILKRQESPTSTSINNNKATDETLSTANCDDSLTASVNMSQVRLYAPAPPVANVNVDKRNVRQRLRDQEAKINALLHSKPSASSASEGVLLKLVQTLESDLKKTEAEKQVLVEQLEALKQQQQEEDEKEEEVVAVVEEAKAPQVLQQADEETLAERLAQVQIELRHKTNEATLLQDRWETTLRRMVQYQVDLETHELHFTDYAAQQFQAGEETLAELKELTAKDQPPASRQLGKKAKHMMSTLLKDLEVLGERYQDSRVHHEQQVADARIAQREWQRRAEYLQAKCQEHAIDIDNEEPVDSTSMMAGPLMTFHQKLRLQQTAAQQTHQELLQQAKASQQQVQQTELERDVLQQEVQRLQQTVAKLHTVTCQQQEALQQAQTQAAQAQAQASQKSKKKWGFLAKKKNTTTPPPPALPQVNLTAALAPLQGESQRFDMLQQRLQQQASLLTQTHQELQRSKRQTFQLQQTVTDLRLEQEQTKAVEENKVLQNLVQQEAKRSQEQAATIEELRAQLEALQSGSKSNSKDAVEAEA